jgi:deubiquitinase
MPALDCIPTPDCISLPARESGSDNEPYCPARLVSAGSIAGVFNDDFSSQTLKELELAVVEKSDSGIGDVDCLDILLNIALREDELGNEAERIVFDLFAGRSGNDGSDADEISLRCLKFYQLAVKRDTGTQWFGKLQKLSHLSYMAGAAPQATAEEKEDIVSFFPDAIPQVSQEQLYPHEDVWRTGRMVGTDEMDASLKVLEDRVRLEQPQSGHDFSINFPISLYAPGSTGNLLTAQLLSQKQTSAVTESDHPFKKINIFPLNHDNHWMLFVAYPAPSLSQPDKLAVVVFSSTESLTRESRKVFAEAATILDAGRVAYVEKNLQEHMCNGCGVLVVEAVSQILANREKKPTHVLRQFATDFQSRSRADLDAFNISRRREMLGDYINVSRRSQQGPATS